MKKILDINLKTLEVGISIVHNEEVIVFNDNDLVYEAPILAGYGVVGINRLNILCEDNSSKVGGYFAHYLKCNGYDYLVLRDKSREPIYLYIDKDNIEIRKANHLYYMSPKETEKLIKKELNSENLEISEIGLAGANKIDFAKIMFRGTKSCGKNGLGKMMGEKNVKAVVLKGQDSLKAKDEDKLSEINALMINRVNNNGQHWYDDRNSCYGCILNCKSTAIKKIMELDFSIEEAKEIDDICNVLGMDSIVFASMLNAYKINNELIEIGYLDFADKIVNHHIDLNTYINIEEFNIKDKSKDKLRNELEELGFCQFLINKNIIDYSLKEELIKSILG